MASLDYYEVLGISRDANFDQINKAYRRLAKSTHPDVNEEPDASAKFKKLVEAYDVLKDPKKRKRYDDKQRISANFRDSFSYSCPCEFDRTWSVKNINTNLEISLKEAYEGCTKKIKVKVKQPCKKCLSKGFTEFSSCNHCEGRGFKNVLQGFFNIQKKCNVCLGEKKIPSLECEDCGGSGSSGIIEKYFNVLIRPGIESISRIRLSEAGEKNPDGRCGDIIVSISVKNHDFIQRQGLDLLVGVDIFYTQLVTGTKLNLDKYILSDKSGLIEIPAGTNVGQRFKVEGLGMPSVIDPKIKGNLIVEIGLKVPKKISKEHEKLLFDLFEIEKNE